PAREHLLAQATPILQITRQSETLIVPEEPALNCTHTTLALEIPSDFQQLKAVDAALAMRWRKTTRTLFEHYFAAGYMATECLFDQSQGVRRNIYLLQKAVDLQN